MRRIIRPKVTQKLLGIGHSKFYEDVKTGRLPPLVRLGPRSVGHLEDELEQYIEGLSAARARKNEHSSATAAEFYGRPKIPLKEIKAAPHEPPTRRCDVSIR